MNVSAPSPIARVSGDSAKQRPRICFVAQNAFGQLAGIESGHVGGIERQQAMMAKWLARNDFDVSLVTWHANRADGERIEGVRHLQLCRKDAGLPGLRFFHPRWSSLNAALARADADIYYYNCGDCGVGQISRWCRGHGRVSVYSVAHDSDCSPALPLMTAWHDRQLYRHGLRLVDHIVAQTYRQQAMMKSAFGRDATVLPMPCAFPATDADAARVTPAGDELRAVWVGRIVENKRLEWLLDCAERTPRVTFEVAGASNHGAEYAQRLFARGSAMANVRMLGRVAPMAMREVYSRAHVLLCTSSSEGFPNTFLEAWSQGIPVVTTFDPDDIVSKHGLGWSVGTLDGLVESLEQARNDAGAWLDRSRAARSYYAEHHELSRCMRRFADFFCGVTR